MRLSFNIAYRFLKSSKGQSFLIILGIAIGVSVQVFIGSLIQGLQKSLIDKTIGDSSHITITSKTDDKLISDYEDVIAKIKDSDSRVTVVSPSADGSVFLKYNDKSYPLVARGFEIQSANSIYKLSDSIIEGSLPEGDDEITIGKNLKEEASLDVGEKVQLATPKGNIKEYKIAGVFDLKVASLNKSWGITTIGSVQDLMGYEGTVTSIESQIDYDQVFKADEVQISIENKLNNSDIKVENWKIQNEQLLSGLSGQSASSNMIQVFVLISVILGIASVLAISVVQKSKQIGILKAMGIKNKTASQIFIFQGFILGIFGAILGVGFGLGLTYIFSTFALNPDGTPIVELLIDYKFIAGSAVIALLSAIIAALIPARKSSKLDPMEVIKNG